MNDTTNFNQLFWLFIFFALLVLLVLWILIPVWLVQIKNSLNKVVALLEEQNTHVRAARKRQEQKTE